MTNLKLNFAAIIFAIFALTSCQKETMSELNPTTETTTQRMIPAEGIHTVNEVAKTLSTDENRAKYAASRERQIITISPDAGPIFDDTRGEGNTIHSRNAPCLEPNGDNFNGPDNIYLFKVEDTPELIVTHHVTISDLKDDLDLFIYTLDERGYVRECKATSITIGLEDESISVSGLNAGYYIIVVDGWIEQATSTYNLEFYTSAVSANPPSIGYASTISYVQFGEVFEDGSSASLGLLVETEDTDTWKEYGTIIPHFPLDSEMNPALFSFEKVDIDDWSVYLRDDSRGVNLQLDFHRKKVVYKDDAGNNFDLYDILSER